MTRDYSSWIFPFGKYKGKALAEIPDTYLDWIIGEDWFVSQARNHDLLEAIGLELATRKRSHYSVKDQFDRGLGEK